MSNFTFGKSDTGWSIVVPKQLADYSRFKDLIRDMRQWCYDNVGGEQAIYYDDHTRNGWYCILNTFFFKSDNDVTMFILRWNDEVNDD